jgi:hypothetical protein
MTSMISTQSEFLGSSFCGGQALSRSVSHPDSGLSANSPRTGLSVLKSPPCCPKANAICERVIWTIRRECLDWLIPISERHLRSILKSWVEHYNRGRPHSSVGPGVPDPPQELALIRKSESRHRLAAGARVLAKSVLAGLHHEYLLATVPASVIVRRKTCGGVRDANNCGAQCGR